MGNGLSHASANRRETGGDFWQLPLQSNAVQAGGSDRLPGDFPVCPSQGLGLLGSHNRLDLVLEGLDHPGQFFLHPPQLPQLFDLCAHGFLTHCVYLL